MQIFPFGFSTNSLSLSPQTISAGASCSCWYYWQFWPMFFALFNIKDRTRGVMLERVEIYKTVVRLPSTSFCLHFGILYKNKLLYSVKDQFVGADSLVGSVPTYNAKRVTGVPSSNPRSRTFLDPTPFLSSTLLPGYSTLPYPNKVKMANINKIKTILYYSYM